MADPVSQIFAQAQAGSAQGQGFGQFAAQGMQQGLARRRLDLEERQMEREEERQSMLLPLQQEAMRLNNINTGIEVQSRQLQAQAMTQQNAVLPQLYELQMQFQGSPAGYTDPTLINSYRQLTTQYPLAFVGGVGKDIRESIAAAPRINASLDAIVRANQRLQGTDARIESFDPATGRINLAPRQSNVPANLQEAAAITAQRRRVEAATDPATRAALQTELDDMLMQTTPSGMSIETTTPDGTRTVVSTGRPKTSPEGLTTATQTDLQRRETAGLMSLQTLDRLKTVIANNPNAWGVRGSVGSIVETGKGILDPQAEAPVKKAINDADIAFTQLADSFKVDSGQMSNYERLKLEKAAAITGIGESQKSAQDKVANLEDAVVGRLLRVAKTQGKRVEDTVLRRIPESEIPSLGEEGLLTEEDALRWYRLKRATQQQAR